MFQSIRGWLITLPRFAKRAILILADIVMLGVALWAAFALRFDNWAPPRIADEWVIALSAPAAAIPIFFRMGLYRAVVRYLPERVIWTIVKAMTLAVLAWVFIAFISALTGRGVIPRSVPVIYWALGIILVAGSRFTAKAIFWPPVSKSDLMRQAILIYGAGQAGTELANSLRGTYFIAGFIDDDPYLHRREVAGIRVYPRSQLATLVRNYRVKQIILSMPSLPASRRREIVRTISGHGVKVQSLPGISDIASGKYLVSQIREIEIDDLLGRSSVPPDLELIHKMIAGRTIMVTGAGGSIGSELCRKIAASKPQRLILLEANEFALYRIDKELDERSEIQSVPVLGSVTDSRLVRNAIETHGVDVIFHAAAHKHVPLVEANALEGIRNNLFGTRTVADAAFEAGVKDFVLISTDKAVRPTNVMGATKRWAELIVREKAHAAKRAKSGQRFCSVRFGNVLGSNGSVVPLFKQQINQGGPVTITDARMTRYFMSIAEAAELIVQAGALSEGGDVFLLDMGEPMLISDLAENMVRLAGLTIRSQDNPDGDIEIIAIGKRPGEKMYEELFYDPATAKPTRHAKILRGATTPGDHEGLRSSLDALGEALIAEDEKAARSTLFELVIRTDQAEALAKTSVTA